MAVAPLPQLKEHLFRKLTLLTRGMVKMVNFLLKKTLISLMLNLKSYQKMSYDGNVAIRL